MNSREFTRRGEGEKGNEGSLFLQPRIGPPAANGLGDDFSKTDEPLLGFCFFEQTASGLHDDLPKTEPRPRIFLFGERDNAAIAVEVGVEHGDQGAKQEVSQEYMKA